MYKKNLQKRHAHKKAWLRINVCKDFAAAPVLGTETCKLVFMLTVTMASEKTSRKISPPK